ncbi:hypothetical protein EIN_079460 [Entamoeba invadens IP1]|uniref:hypothetical protein n=1 Tax=Entamoeba invadens IP1 TaxID=370355 RepID=UPI0002C3D09B|nr:hypothetical protein EIN_079460 [Entamoeba invadens IP1]ELP85024.1 hypothetical protein EIN_079460 [Entamoeba invadens IP1]|eukprot:XP_004184370.1 hypothetical protein EIN_079460 [Entamoeba invadens IP1]
MEAPDPIQPKVYKFAEKLYSFSEHAEKKKVRTLLPTMMSSSQKVPDTPMNEPKNIGNVHDYSQAERDIPELYTVKPVNKEVSIFTKFAETTGGEVTKEKTDIFEEIMQNEFGDTMVDHPLDMSSKGTFDIILKFCKKTNDPAKEKEKQLDFPYARDRATNYREIVDTMIMKEIDQEKFTLLDSIASVSSLQNSFMKIKEDMCALSERLHATQENVRWLMTGNMKEYQKYQNIRSVMDKMHAINDVIKIVSDVDDLVEEKEYKEAINLINNGLDIIDCKLAGIRCVSKDELYLKQTKARLEKFLKNPEKFVFELFTRIQLIDEVIYNISRKDVREEFKELIPQIVMLFKNVIRSNGQEDFVEKYITSIEGVEHELCYGCLPLEFLKKEEYLNLMMTKQSDSELTLEKNVNLKKFIMKLSINEFMSYFFNMMNKLEEIVVRVEMVQEIYDEVKKNAGVIGIDTEMNKVKERVEDIIVEYAMLMLSYANLRNLKRDEYQLFEKKYIAMIDELQGVVKGTFNKVNKIRTTFFQMYFSTLYICGFDDMLKFIKIEQFVALTDSMNVIELVKGLTQLINPNDVSCRTLKVNEQVMRYQGENYMIIASLDNVCLFISSFLEGFSLNEGGVNEMVFEKANQVFRAWVENMKMYYFVNLIASDVPDDYCWRCICVHQSVQFLVRMMELLTTGFMKSNEEFTMIQDDFATEMKSIRTQIVQFFRLTVRKYMSSKAEEMEGVSVAKPLPTPPKGKDPRKKPLPPSPVVKKGKELGKITDVSEKLNKDINLLVKKYFSDEFQKEIVEEESLALKAIEDEFVESLKEPNFQTKVVSDIEFLKDEVVLKLGK